MKAVTALHCRTVIVSTSEAELTAKLTRPTSSHEMGSQVPSSAHSDLTAGRGRAGCDGREKNGSQCQGIFSTSGTALPFPTSLAKMPFGHLDMLDRNMRCTREYCILCFSPRPVFTTRCGGCVHRGVCENTPTIHSVIPSSVRGRPSRNLREIATKSGVSQPWMDSTTEISCRKAARWSLYMYRREAGVGGDWLSPDPMERVNSSGSSVEVADL